MEPAKIISVAALVACVQEVIEDNFVEVLVQGELSNVAQPASGHCYFTLKDSKAQIRCALFRGQRRALRFDPTEGLAVICRGRVSIYPQRGDLQLIVESMEPEGIGSLQLAFEQVREKLEKEGLFAPERKRKLPAFPATIGVVTSATGAALQDILNVLRRRSAGLRVLLRPVPVQGDGAAEQIATAIAELNAEGSADVLVVGRGGGSREDLWAFNEEVVARAIAASRVPVISAVGHEVDLSIADLVADLRAPTPSAAAELVVQNRLELERHLDQLSLRLARTVRALLTLSWNRLEGMEKRLKAPAQRVREQRSQYENLLRRLQQAVKVQRQGKTRELAHLSGRLNSLSPLAVLARGYAIVRKQPQGRLVYAAAEVAPGDELSLRLSQGELAAVVRRIIAADAEDSPDS